MGSSKLVYEALQERARPCCTTPHLTSTLPILMPGYRLWEVPFYWAGLKACVRPGCRHQEPGLVKALRASRSDDCRHSLLELMMEGASKER